MIVEKLWKSILDYLAEALAPGGLRRIATKFLETPVNQRPEVGSIQTDLENLRLHGEFRAQVARDIKDYLQMNCQSPDFKISALATKSAYLDSIVNCLDATNPHFKVKIIKSFSNRKSNQSRK